MNRPDTVRLQTWLKATGFDPGMIDGIIGPNTIAASARYLLVDHSDESVAQHAFDRLVGSRHAPYVHGIDVSGYQGKINWKKVATSGLCSFAIVKVTEGSTHRQRSAQRNLDGARAWRIPVGGYHYAHPNTGRKNPKDAQREAENFVSHYGTPQPDDLIPWIDAESGLIKSSAYHSFNVDWILQFAETIKKEMGCGVGIYTARWAIQSRLSKADNLDELAKKFPLWFAEYRSEKTENPRKKMAPWEQGSQMIWQWTGHGRVPGIKGDCDRNKATMADIVKLRMFT